MTAPTPATVLRLAQGIPETTENFPVLRELIHALKDLVALAEKDKPSPAPFDYMAPLPPLNIRKPQPWESISQKEVMP